MHGLRRFVGVMLLILTEATCVAGPPPSGLGKGDSVEPWNPVHVAGPDRGTTNCPVCTYLERPAVVVFAKDGADVIDLASRVERLVAAHQAKEFKGFVAVTDARPERAKDIATTARVERSALCILNPVTRERDLRAYRIYPEAANTIMVYQNYKVVATFVNLPARDFGKVEEVVNQLLK
jgi:hypothetical protein